NNNYDNYIFQNWDGTNWVNSNMYSFTYDSNDNTIIELSEYWDGTVWIFDYRYSYAYDSNNKRTVSLYQIWNVSSSAWDNADRNVNTYQTGGDLLLTSLYQNWVNSNWQNQSLYSYTYDPTELQLLIESTYQTWDGAAWVNDSRTLYTWTKVTDVEDDFNLTDFKLFNNYPNPFNPSTTIKYSISQNSFVRLTIYNILGKEIKEIINGVRDAGIYEENFNASGLSSGAYFCRIEALTSDGKKNFISVMKMLLIK
ncbi:MAG TPA: T9SS type A sorting domain-containing protein, partial [Ignavibacteriaceae bacterium]